MKTNKQITIEELTRFLKFIVSNNLEETYKGDFATTLLSKLHLEKGVVIAEGEVDFIDNKMLIRGFRKSIAIEFENEFICEGLIILAGKKGKLIFIEDKEE